MFYKLRNRGSAVHAMNDTPLQLDYAPGEPIRRRMRRRVLAATTIIVITLLYLYGPDLWSRVQNVYIWYRLSTYQADPKQIVYEDNPRGVTALLASGQGYASHAPAKGPPSAYLAPDVAGGAFGGSHGTLFLHKRSASADKTTILALDLSERIDAPQENGISFIVLVSYSRLLTWAKGLAGTEWKAVIFLKDAAVTGTPVRFFAGQPDAADESHFTIGYEIGGRLGVIDGWLMNDGSVNLKVREDSQK